MSKVLAAFLQCSGLAIIVVGLAMVYIPAAVIVGGISATTLGIWLELKRAG